VANVPPTWCAAHSVQGAVEQDVRGPKTAGKGVFLVVVVVLNPARVRGRVGHLTLSLSCAQSNSCQRKRSGIGIPGPLLDVGALSILICEHSGFALGTFLSRPHLEATSSSSTWSRRWPSSTCGTGERPPSMWHPASLRARSWSGIVWHGITFHIRKVSVPGRPSLVRACGNCPFILRYHTKE